MKQDKDPISKIIEVSGNILLVLIVAIVSLQVTFRNFTHLSLTWSSELSSLLFVWLSFLGAISLQRDDSHVGVDILLIHIPQKITFWIRNVGRIMIMAMFLGIMINSIPILKTSLTIEGSTLPVSLFWSRIPIDIGAMGCLVYTFLHFFRDLRSIRGE